MGLNDTLIALIPKNKIHVLVSHYRPINLCNVLYKIAAKVLTNRLKLILPAIIAPTHCALILGR